MNKKEFLDKLQTQLAGLPQSDIKQTIDFYEEIIEERIEEGKTEEEAIADIGLVEDIVSQIISDTPLPKLMKEKIRPKRVLRVWEVVLIVLGSPIWLSLGIAVVAVILSLYISLWSVIISLWSVFGALIGGAFGGVLAGSVFICDGNILSGIAMFGAGSVCAGLSIFMFYGCRAASKGILVLTKKIAIWIKNCFIQKEGV